VSNVHLRSTGRGFECWVEDWNDGTGEFEVVAEAKILRAGDTLLIDDIYTEPDHRRRGHASAIIRRLKATGLDVAPIGVLPEAVPFWRKHGMTDALGEER